MENNIYPFEWLETIIFKTLSPKLNNAISLSADNLYDISEDVVTESHKVQMHIKNEIFSLKKKRQIRLTVRKYHSTLIFLLDNIMDRRNNDTFQSAQLLSTIDIIISSLDELLSFIEARFSYFLSLDERVPVTYLIVSRRELQLKLNRIKSIELRNEFDKISMSNIIAELTSIIEVSNNIKFTYRQILYLRDILKSLELLDYSIVPTSIFSALDELLVSKNFNSLSYITNITERLTNSMKPDLSLSAKLSTLLLYYKDFNHLYSNERITLDPGLQNIKDVLDKWFKFEIEFLNNKIELEHGLITGAGNSGEQVEKEKDNKIECILSTDQMGLIIRATDEARIVKAKSMTLVFKTIVPYLSTPHKKSLSYQSVRSKSYNAEEKDKEIAIQTLEKIIKKIRTY
ncbi:hypothetical protein [Flavobacterium sp. FlaQc-47]|uniref:hypothetical protein n=1 Tax=Flavobacterium sp. FlaQc-47 TaxID=3374180 RepID=UPI0037578BBA